MMSISHQGRCFVCTDVAVMIFSPCYDEVVEVDKKTKLLSGTHPGAQRKLTR